MEEPARIIPSQPLLALAPRAASGDKIRARRFVPGKSTAKPVYRLGKSRRCRQSHVGTSILANTIGNAIADQVATSQAPGAPTDLLAGTPYDGPGYSVTDGAGIAVDSAASSTAAASQSSSPTALSQLTLQQRIALLDAALPAATDGMAVAADSSQIDSSQRAVLSRSSNLLNYGNVEVSFGGQLDNGLAAGQSYMVDGKGFIFIDASQDDYFMSDGTVNLTSLEATLVHEGTHISDYLNWGHSVQTLGQLRQTERDAYSAQADFYVAEGISPLSYDALTSSGATKLPLTAGNVNAIAESDVKSEYPGIYVQLLANHNSMASYDAKYSQHIPIPPRPTLYSLPRDLGRN